MSKSPFLLLPSELRNQIITYVVSDDLVSPADVFHRAAALLHVNQGLRHEYLDAVASSRSVTLYNFYPDTAIWEIVNDKPAKLKIVLEGSFTDLFHLNSLASAQRYCENGTASHSDHRCGMLSVACDGSQKQRVWLWKSSA